RPDLRAMPERQPDMGEDGALAGDEPALRLVDGGIAVRQLPAGKALGELPRRQFLMVEPVLDARGERARRHAAAARPGVDGTRDEEQLLAVRLLRLAPQAIGVAQQRHVVGMLEIGEADDAVDAVGRAHAMADVEALEPEHALAAPREMICRGAPHAAHADDDDVVTFTRTHGRLRKSGWPPQIGSSRIDREEGTLRQPPVTLMCRPTAGWRRRRSMTKSWPRGLRAMARSIASSSGPSLIEARSGVRRSAASSWPRHM